MKNITLYFIIFIIILLIILGTNWFINMEDSKSLSKEFGFDSTNLLDMPYNDSTPKNKHVGVIGGGISGLSTAYYLLKEGYNVTLLESKQRVGGNNEAYIENGNMYPTSIVYYKPKQQPHHNKICSELGIEHIRGEWEEGTIEFKDSYLTTSQTLSLIQTFTQFIKILTFQETIDFITIVILLRKEFLDSPDLKISVAECLGTRLINTEVFKDVIMGVVGVNCWCRLEDINEFPADIFAALIWEFSLPIRRRCNGIENVSILDGRIIDALEEANLKDSNYLQYLGKKVTYIEKTDNSNYNIYTSFNETYNFDLVVLTMQPRFANKIIKSSITHDTNINISNKLINELIKWDDTLECCTFIHNDNSRIKQGSFHYERIKITHNDEYTHFIRDYNEAMQNPNSVAQLERKYKITPLERQSPISLETEVVLIRSSQSIIKSNFWMCKFNDGKNMVLPGRSLIARSNELMADKGRFGSKIFNGIYQLKAAETLKILEPSYCIEQGAEFIITEMGSLTIDAR